MARYRKKPVTIDADQWWPPGDPRYNASAHRIEPNHADVPVGAIVRDEASGVYRIKSLEGWFDLTPGDWIIVGVKGERYACKPDIFAMTYEKAE